MHWMQPSIDYLSFMSEFALEKLRARFGSVPKESVLWCVTVPAIWNEKSKILVRQAATIAGIVDEYTQDSLVIIFEPEAAALYTLSNVKELQILQDCSFMVLDAGGGTVDLTVHSIQRGSGKPPTYVDRYGAADGPGDSASQHGGDFIRSSRGNLQRQATSGEARSSVDGASVTRGQNPFVMQIDGDQRVRLRELSRGSGGHCGSTYVDKEFLRYFQQQIGKENYDRLRKERRDLVYALLQEWEQVKRSYGGPEASSGDDYDLVLLPSGLLKYVPEEVKEKWEEDFEEGNFGIPSQKMVEIFHTAVDTCLRLIEEQLALCGGRCDYMILVGGFCSSKYLIKRVKSKFPDSFKRVVVPNDPTSAVVRGAVKYGLFPAMIQSRRSRFSYGYMTNVARNIMVEADPRDIWTDGIQDYVQVFKCLVAENQEIDPDQEFVATSFVMRTNSNRLEIDLLAADERLEPGEFYSMSRVNAKLVGRMIATISAAHCDQRVDMTLILGTTETTVRAKIVSTGEELLAKFTAT
nr:hypothetical protein HK105_003344 [Polyrhizophydium stewartii]